MEVSHMTNCSNVSSPEQQPMPPSPLSSSSPPPQLDYDVVVILAAMLCALVCALGLNSMLQCVVRCTRRAVADPVGWVEHRRASAGLKREDVVALPVATYVASPAPPSAAGCAICLSDFADGERVRLLPACGHRFHVVCIDRWLLAHRSCPTCRRRPSPEADDGHGAVGEGHHRLQVLAAA
uniref:RING-type domain-containing protein n=1 Tax=Oryza punctata TaxID=4537 RepID=A0A0E0LEF5_ORYPU